MHLYDAMGTAVDLLKTQQPKFRRVMLVVGESQDLASDSKLALVLRDAQHLGNPGTTADLTAASIFVVLLEGGWRP